MKRKMLRFVKFKYPLKYGRNNILLIEINDKYTLAFKGTKTILNQHVLTNLYKRNVIIPDVKYILSPSIKYIKFTNNTVNRNLNHYNTLCNKIVHKDGTILLHSSDIATFLINGEKVCTFNRNSFLNIIEYYMLNRFF
jgi:hypothetical protein